MYVGITMRTLAVRLREHAEGGPKANGFVPWNTRSEIHTAMNWSNTTVQDLEDADLKSLLGQLQQSRALQELISLSESGS